jgi:predicted Zn finger-like uncharacterized protein
MKITCQSCGAKYAIADDKVVGRKVKVRCKSCSTAIVVDGTAPAEAPYGGGEDDEATRIVQGPPGFGDEPAGPDAWSVNLSETDQRTMTTEEIVSGWHSGLITEEAFVWKDGMTDWVPVLEMTELYDAISAAAQPSAPPPAAAAPSAPPAPAAPPPAAAPAAGFGLMGGPAPEAARVSGGRAAGGADLFGSVASAGGEYDPALAAPAAEAGQHSYDAKPTGARNENSVLFSLDALKAGFGGPAPAQQAPPPRQQSGGKANLDDLMGIGGSGGNPLFGLGANQALLTAPAPEPEPPPPPPPPSVPPPGPGGQVASIVPPPARTNKVLIAVAGGAVLLVLLLGGALALTLGHGKEEKVAKNDTKAAGSGDSKTDQAKKDDKTDQAKKDDKTDQAKDDKKEEAAKSDAGSAKPSESASSEAPPKNATPEEQKRFYEALKKKKTEAAKKKEEAPAETAATAKKHEVSASFNKGAAISSLTSAAAAAASCKRPGGPTGRGRAIVTFAPSGRVTSANVSGGGFGGTTVGGCVASVFRHAHIPPFSGNAVTVAKSFTIPQ